ncbi:peptidoglycan D,D-transpeptidase FtsI family protein [Nocardioides plantarum]|uniref:Peptidoglycan D,D-transpeptidase FtsI family protein n=2 Tax=Nocardioides plantarum TaxID=29299 RepID=A0ABV5KDV8_9ACTN|nr:penicillin-binding protein 2 [Nocardioides plantarum]
MTGRLRRGSPAFRLRVGFVFILMILSLFAARLVQLQGVDPGQYAQMAAAEGKISVVLPAERGDIVDRNGEPLADSIDGLMIVADPSLTKKRAPELASFLARRLHLDYLTVLERLRVPDSKFQYVARQVPAARARDVVDAARAKKFVGLYTREDPVRVYPAGPVAANVVGFLGDPKKDGSASPAAGLEIAFNKFLSGHDGEARYQVGASGSQIPLGDNTVDPARNGKRLTLTIDRDLQWYCQQVLAEAVRNAKGDSGTVIVGDSRTGEVLCLADYPTYDASRPDLSSKDRYGTPSLSNPYEPGSVEKTLTMAALIDAGKVTSRTRFEVPGVLSDRQDRPIHDYFEHPTLRMTLAGILAKSSNIGTVIAADKFDRGQLRSYLTDFGLGSRTGVGLGGETPGILPSGSDWTSQAGDRIAFGQSLSVNALQMWGAVNTIANGGERIDPSIVKGVASLDDGTKVGTGVAQRRRVVSQDAARQTSEMMERVLDPKAGVAPQAAVPGYRVAGKTGTAQRAVDGVYDGSLSVSFAGFAPADDPRFTAYVVVHNPRNGGGGGSVGGPAFSKIMGYALRRYAVPPTNTPPSRLPTTW